MRDGGGKQKGSAFEREICRKLSEWITGNKKPEIFWRTSSSGAQATISGNSNMYGDIMAINGGGGEWFTNYFSIECKFYKNFDMLAYLECRGDLNSWWEQTLNDAYKSKRNPLLIFKKNRGIIYCITDERTYFMMQGCVGNNLHLGTARIYRNDRKNERIKKEVLFQFDRFIELVDAKSLEFIFKHEK